MYAHALLLLIAVAAPAAAQLPADSLPTDTSRRNVLWIYVEDTNDWMSGYGDEVVETPNIDALAARGTRFTRAYMPAGVCSPTRVIVAPGPSTWAGHLFHLQVLVAGAGFEPATS
ncbi:MAG TPA: hypothetical protein EYF98_02110, partial [Planctomycetes bacterium]|nr:hypothetical protein [Planctomycetota bacterium]